MISRIALNGFMRNPILLWLFLSVTPFPSDVWAETCEPLPDVVMNKNIATLVIGEILVRPKDIFNTSLLSTSTMIHSAANVLHIRTRSSAILSALPFESGDTYSWRVLKEGERTLRAKRHLRSAVIRPIQRCGRKIDIEVTTVDNWTLTPSISFGSSGGVNRYSLEIHDSNVLGLGKEIRLRQTRRDDINSSLFTFNDDNVFGSRHKLGVELGDADEGKRYSIVGGLPFYSNAAEKSWWIQARQAINSVDSDSRDPVNLSVKSEMVDIRVAKRIDRSQHGFARLGFGFRYSRQLTTQPENSLSVVDETDVDELYPFITAHWEKNNWLEQINFESLGKVEDINLGLSAIVEAGLILNLFGNNTDALRLDLTLGRGWKTNANGIHLLALQHTRYFDSRAVSRYQASLRYQNFYRLGDRNQLAMHLTAERNQGYSSVYRYKVGGEYGLRAYPNEYQQGENRLLGIVELRRVNEWTPLSLINTAWTMFFETGKAWSRDDSADTLSNAGVGLAFTPTRGSKPGITRVDITFPLNIRNELEGFQLFVGSTINF